MKFIFRKAQKQELNKALNLLYLAAQRLKEKGVNQWAFWLNPSQEKINWVEEGFTNQEFYFVQNQDQEIFAMFRLMPKDELYWGKQTKNAFYIHSLVVDPAFAGKQIGQKIIWQIETELLEKGVFTLRLDCNSASLSLCQYYEKLGFRKVGEKQMPDSLNNLYEKELPESKNQTKTFYASSRQEWRMWLEKNHQTETSVWLIIYRKESAISSVYYPEAVDEALCFGWIDSKANKRNELSFYQFFSKRNPKSNWSKVNKEKIAKLEKQGLLTASGLEMVEIAQKQALGQHWIWSKTFIFLRICKPCLIKIRRLLKIGKIFLVLPNVYFRMDFERQTRRNTPKKE